MLRNFHGDYPEGVLLFLVLAPNTTLQLTDQDTFNPIAVQNHCYVN